MKNTDQKPYITDVYPDKAQYTYNEKVQITVETVNPCSIIVSAVIQMAVTDLDKIIYKTDEAVELEPGINNIFFSFVPPANESKGYGADAALALNKEVKGVYPETLVEKESDIYSIVVDSEIADAQPGDTDGNAICTLSTAFDVVSSWKEAVRYGFLSEFYLQDENDADDVKQMAKYHLNVIQFYDWMYRHDNLIPDGDYFVDPLGRNLSRTAIKNKIDACHKYGMKALAYGAVYAASSEFYETHRDWALYGNNGKVQSLGEWLYIMNTAPDSPWTEHIVGEFSKAVEKLGFDGIHMDTFGFPKSAYSVLSGVKKLEKLEEHFPFLICRTRRELESIKKNIGLSFNAVSSWPVEVVAQAEQDVIYIEVWDPCEKYFQLNQLIQHARSLAKKPVVLAAYLSPFADKRREENVYVQKYNQPYDEQKAQNCFLLVSAVIFASGGYHFFLGENNGVLTNNYYVDYGKISKAFERSVRNYYDFIVRYTNLLFDPEIRDLSMTHANGINDEYKFENGLFSSYGETGKIWTIIREKPGYKIISLINLNGIESDIWNEGKENRPVMVKDIWITALVDEKVDGVFAASPDRNNGRAEVLEFHYTEGIRGNYLRFRLPVLEVWNLVYIKVYQEINELNDLKV